MSVSKLKWQAKPRGQTLKIKQIQHTTDFNVWHFYNSAKSSPIAVPRASTRCQESLERVLCCFLGGKMREKL